MKGAFYDTMLSFLFWFYSLGISCVDAPYGGLVSQAPAVKCFRFRWQQLMGFLLLFLAISSKPFYVNE